MRLQALEEIQWIHILDEDETPWQLNTTLGEGAEGPWGTSVEEAIDLFESQSGMQVSREDYYQRGPTLFLYRTSSTRSAQDINTTGNWDEDAVIPELLAYFGQPEIQTIQQAQEAYQAYEAGTLNEESQAWGILYDIVESLELDDYYDVSIVRFKADGAEWVLFETEENAEEAARADVKRMLEENPEYFDQDWLLGQVGGQRMRDFFEEIYNEWNYSYAEDVADEGGQGYESRLTDELVEREIVTDEEAEAEGFDPRDHIDEFVEKMTEDQLDEGNDGYDHYKFNIGDEEAAKLVIDNNLIDVEGTAQAAMDEDGWAHFISHYDGDYHLTDGDMVLIREN